MKRSGNIYHQVLSFDNLIKACRIAQRGKTKQGNVAAFNFRLEQNVLSLQHQLKTKEYHPGGYREFFVYEPKKRMISAAPYRDRVVHHALCNIIEPILDNTFIDDSYANRKGKGSHAAINKFSRLARNNKYVLKADIRKFFPSIVHKILKTEIRKHISCPDTLWLIDTIIDASNKQEHVGWLFPNDDLFTNLQCRKGLPMGNQTSQFFANVYLNRFDHFIKENLRCKGYIRYVDDFVLFSNDKRRLHEYRKMIEDFLVSYRLKIHPDKTQVISTRQGIDFLGHKIFPEYRLIKKQNLKRLNKRIEKKLTKYKHGHFTEKELIDSLRGWIGHAYHADTYQLRLRIINNLLRVVGSPDLIVRGGSWNNNDNNSRVANRNNNNPTNSNNNNGFRVLQYLSLMPEFGFLRKPKASKVVIPELITCACNMAE